MEVATWDEAFTPSLDQLEAKVCDLATRVNAAEYEFLVAVRKFDLSQGWKRYHLNSCAEWLNMKCGVVLGTAREKVRTAHALAGLPLMSASFERGELSYSNVRALTRVATIENEDVLIGYARNRPASMVEKYCRHLRNVQRVASARDANEMFQERFLSYTVLGDGTVSLTIELPPEEGELVMQAVAHAARQLERESASCDDASLQQRNADALVRVAREYFAEANETGRTATVADHYQVVVHVDEAALSQAKGKSDLPIESVRRLLCDTSMRTIVEDANGSPLDVGRKRRVVSAQLRQALLSRDEQCRYPGCSHKLWLEAHHVVHWVDGGETTVDNLLLLCSKHHRLLHEGAFALNPVGDGSLTVKTRSGQVLNMVREPESRVYSLPGAIS